MVWSNWKGTAVLAGLGSLSLVCASLVYSQQPAPRPLPAGVDPNQVVTIQEPGKPPMDCIILKTYRVADGKVAYDVRPLAGGETMTFVDGSGTMPESKKSGFAPWNKNKPGDYVEERFVGTPDLGSKVPATAAAKTPTVEEFRTIQEANKPAQKCRVIAKWKTNDGNAACQMQALDSGEILTVVEMGPSQTAPGSTAKTVATRIYHWGRNTTPPPGVPVPPVQETVVAQAPTTSKTTDLPKKTDHLPPALDTKKSDDTVSSFGKPAVESPAPLAVDPKSLPKTVATPPSSTPPLPLVPAALVTGDAKLPSMPPTPVLPPPAISTQASLPPASTLPVTRADTVKDPLASPERFAVAGKDVVDTSKPVGSTKAVADTKPVTDTKPATTTASDPGPSLPPGSKSVITAANGGYTPYLPVPIVTMPQARPPMPPAAQLPQAPQQAPNPTWYSNAFTPPLPPNAVSEQMLMAQQQQQQMQAMAMMQGGYPPPMGYQQSPYGPMAMSMPPGRGSVPMGYQGPMPPNPAGGMPMMAQGYPMVPQGYPMAPQGYPMMPQGYPPQGYPMMPHGYPMAPMMPGMQPAQYVNPSMDRPGTMINSSMSMQQKIGILQTAIYPSAREEAVISLCESEARSQPQVVQLLLQVAKDDPAPMVRAACVNGLARLHVSSEPMMQTLTALKADADPRVRHAVDEAMSRLAPASGIQQTGGKQ